MCKVVYNSSESELDVQREEIVIDQNLGKKCFRWECAEEERGQHWRDKVQKGNWGNLRKGQGPKYGGCESADKENKPGIFPKS